MASSIRNFGIVGFALVGWSSCAYAADPFEAPSATPIFSILAEGWGGGSFVRGRTGTAIEGGEKDSLFAYGGDLRIGVLFSPGFFLQGEVSGEHTKNDGANNNFDGFSSAAAHVAFRNDQFLLGGFGGLGTTYSEAAGGSNNDDGFWFAGAEGQYYMDNLILYGQVGYFDNKDSLDFIGNAVFVKAQARYYLSDSTKLTGSVAYAAAHEGFDELATNIFDWGLRFDQGLGDVPVSLFAAYNGSSYNNGIGSYTDHVVKVGLQIKLGGSSGAGFEHNGASLDLPNFGRWVAAGNSID